MKKLTLSINILAVVFCASCAEEYVPEYLAQRENFSVTAIGNRKKGTRQYNSALPGGRVLRETEVSFIPHFSHALAFPTDIDSVDAGNGVGLFCEYQAERPDEVSGETRYFEFRIKHLEQSEATSEWAVDNMSILMGVRITQPWLSTISTYYAFGAGYRTIDFTLSDDLTGVAGYFSMGLEVSLGSSGMMLLDAEGQYLWSDDEDVASYVLSVGLGLKL